MASPELTLLGNVTAPSPFAPPHRQITLSAGSFNAQDSMGMIAYAVTPMEFVLDAHFFQWVSYQETSISPQIRGNGALWKGEVEVTFGGAPLLLCHLNTPFYRHIGCFFFGDTLYDAFTVTLDFNDFNGTFEYLMKIPTKAGDNTARSVSPILLDIQDLVPVPVAAIILFAHSYITSFQDGSKGELDPEVEIGLCLVLARWVEADVWFYQKESHDIQSHLGFPLSDAMRYMRQKSEPKDTIEMTVEWLRDIGIPPGSVGSPRENPAYLQMMKGCTSKETPQFSFSTCLPGFLAAYFANALSRITIAKEEEEDILISLSADANSTVIYNTYFEHVYAYGFRGSTTLRLAFSALFLQVLIALIHLSVTVFDRRP